MAASRPVSTRLLGKLRLNAWSTRDLDACEWDKPGVAGKFASLLSQMNTTLWPG